MTEMKRNRRSFKRFALCLFLAPVLVNMPLILLGSVGGMILTALETLLPEVGQSLTGAKVAAIVLAFVSGFAVFFGGGQYLLFGGVALWFLLAQLPLRLWICALALFVVNAVVAGLTFAVGDQQFARLCLYYGSFFAPLWGVAFAWLYKRAPQAAT